MDQNTCDNCGLHFATEDELRNHKRKYCAGSAYDDVAKLDQRLADLRHARPDERAGLGEIRDYLGGAGNATSGAGPAYRAPSASMGALQPSGTNGGAGANRGSLLEQAERLAEDRQRQRQVLDAYDEDTLGLLRDLGTRKERELKAQIEKEEIQRAIKNADRQELGTLEGQKKGELQKLANEREAVRVKERGLMDEIGKMESSLMDQERYFKEERANAQSADPTARGAAMKGLRDKEIAWAESRAAQVARVKLERERLENDRNRIMGQLEGVGRRGQAPGGYGTPGRAGSGFRGNPAARRVGGALALEKPPSGSGFRHPALEPSLKDQLVADQVRLNRLKAEQQAYHQNQMGPLDVDEVEVLRRELDNKPGFPDGVQRLRDQYAGEQDPLDQEGYLNALRGRLDKEAAGPRSNPNYGAPPSRPPNMQKPASSLGANKPPWAPQPNQPGRPPTKGIMSKLDNLEGLLLRGSGQAPPGQPATNPQDFAAAARGYNPAQQSPWLPGGPPSVGPRAGGGMNPNLPPMMQPRAAWPPGQPGFGAQPLEAANPYVSTGDPALAHLAVMVHNQDEENRKLREALEGFGRNSNSQDELGGVIKGAQQVLGQLSNAAGGPSSSGASGTGGGQQVDRVLPDEFAFRQNESRCQDLEVEERALMNLAAQEYDQLRVLQNLPKDSELYAYKLKQYKELSAMRAEVEKVLQEQRLQKIQRDFDKQKADEERGQRHAEWIEHQKRQILEGRIGGEGAQPFPQQPAFGEPQQQYDPAPRREPMQYQQARPPATQALEAPSRPPLEQRFQPQPTRATIAQAAAPKAPSQLDVYDPETGFLASIDLLFGVHRTVRTIRVVHMILAGAQAIEKPVEVGPAEAEADPKNRDLNKCVLGARHQFSVRPSTNTRLLLEVQAVDRTQKSGHLSLGWTWLELFEGNSARDLRVGRWALPAYEGPARPDLFGDQSHLVQPPKPTATVGVCVKIGLATDPMFRSEPGSHTTANEYSVPREHANIRRQLPPPQAPVQQRPQPQIPPQQRQQPQPGRPPQRSPVAGKDPNYRCAGLRFTLHYAATPQDYGDDFSIWLQCQEPKDVPDAAGEGAAIVRDNGKLCEAEASSLPYDGVVRADRGTKIAFMQANDIRVFADGAPPPQGAVGSSPFKLEQTMQVRSLAELECEWLRDFYTLYWDIGKRPLYLVASLCGRPAGSKGPVPVAYAAFDICERASGKLQYGFHEVPLWAPPIRLDPASRVPVEGARLGFSLEDPLGDPLDQTQNDPYRAPSGGQQPRQRPETGTISEQFLANVDKQFTYSDGWSTGEALDIYVDGARLLPDNVTVTRLTVRVVNSQLEDQQAPDTVLAAVDRSTLRNQTYGLKYELRPQRPLKPTSLVYMKIETWDKSTGQSCFVGFSYFPLFMDAREEMPPSTDDVTEMSVLTGNYQMPLYSQHVSESVPFTYESFVFLERVPTASLLVRVTRARRDPRGGVLNSRDLPPDRQDELYEPAPEYKEGVYGTSYFPVTEDEVKIMKLRRRRANPPLARVVEEVLQIRNIDPSNISPADEARYLEQMATTDRNSPMLDLNYHSQYEPSLGIRVNVNAIHANQVTGFFGVVASVIPPASLYDGNLQSPPKDAFTFVEPDYDSRVETVKFAEGDAVVLGFEAKHPGMSLLLDIKVYLPDQGRFTDYGFALCPVLRNLDTDGDATTSEWYVGSGVFSVPVYEGPIPAAVIDQLKQAEDPLALLQNLRDAQKIGLLASTSIIVRVVDTQRKVHFHKSLEEEPPSTVYLEPAQLQTHVYRPPAKGALAQNTPTLGDLVPQQWAADLPGFSGHLENEFRGFLGL